MLLFFDSQEQLRELSVCYRAASLRLEEPAQAADIFGVEKENEEERAALFVRQRLGLLEEEIFQVTAWSQEKKVSISEEGLGRMVKAALLRVRGSMEEVLPVQLISGAFCSPEDRRGCVLDAASSYELFGTEYAVGNTVYIDEKPYILRGIVKEKVPVAMIQDTDSQTVFENLELRCENPQQQFTPAEGITVVETPFYTELLNHLAQLPFWLVLAWCMVKLLQKALGLCLEGILWKQAAAWRQKGWRLAGLLCIMGIEAAVVYFLLQTGFLRLPLVFPERYIPSRWSDFDFWGRKWEELKQLHQEISYLSPCLKDVVFREYFWRLLTEWIFGIGAFLGFSYFIAISDKRELHKKELDRMENQ